MSTATRTPLPLYLEPHAAAARGRCAGCALATSSGGCQGVEEADYRAITSRGACRTELLAAWSKTVTARALRRTVARRTLDEEGVSEILLAGLERLLRYPPSRPARGDVVRDWLVHPRLGNLLFVYGSQALQRRRERSPVLVVDRGGDAPSALEARSTPGPSPEHSVLRDERSLAASRVAAALATVAAYHPEGAVLLLSEALDVDDLNELLPEPLAQIVGLVGQERGRRARLRRLYSDDLLRQRLARWMRQRGAATDALEDWSGAGERLSNRQLGNRANAAVDALRGALRAHATPARAAR